MDFEAVSNLLSIQMVEMQVVIVESTRKEIIVATGTTSGTLGIVKSILNSCEEFRVPLDFLVISHPPFDFIAEITDLEYLLVCIDLGTRNM